SPSMSIEGEVQNVIGSPMPNPFTNTTTIKLHLTKSQDISIELIDMNGRIVSTRVDNFGGEQEYLIDIDGINLANGIYTLRISGRDFSKSHKLILNR
ncbi:MAG: T9SS type A sorting domain-containing protein, partial [Bacteroidota bacterium]